VTHDPYPGLLQTGIQRLKARLAKFGYGLAETRPRADRYFLRFGNVGCGLLASISVDAAGWQVVVLGNRVRYDTGELTTRVPTVEALDDLLDRLDPPPSPTPPPEPRQRMTESRMDRLVVLADAVRLSPPTVDDLLGETAWPVKTRTTTR
jgi:hypothetical protein